MGPLSGAAVLGERAGLDATGRAALTSLGRVVFAAGDVVVLDLRASEVPAGDSPRATGAGGPGRAAS